MAAAKGGFTSVVTMPSTNPPIETKSDIIFLIERAINHIVEILPTGCITKQLKEQEITEMYDMYINGAVAFTDDKKSIQNSMLMNIALEYVKNFNGLTIKNDINLFANYDLVVLTDMKNSEMRYKELLVNNLQEKIVFPSILR